MTKSKFFLNVCLQFLFPTHCCFCKRHKIIHNKLLCRTCSELLQLAETVNRCKGCFSSSLSPFCGACFAEEKWSYAYATENFGPAKALLEELKSPKKSKVLECMAALMVVQLCRISWQLPNFLIPSPRDLAITLPLAKAMSQLLQIPYEDLICPCFSSGYRWKRKKNLSNCTLLIVDSYDPKPDPFIWLILEEAAPKEIIFLSFCGNDLNVSLF